MEATVATLKENIINIDLYKCNPTHQKKPATAERTHSLGSGSGFREFYEREYNIVVYGVPEPNSKDITNTCKNSAR